MSARLRRLACSLTAQALLIVVASRLVLAGVNWYSLKTMPPDWTGLGWLVGGWARWDAGHYIRIATNGYVHPDDPGSPAFFPLFPLLMRGLVLLAGRDVSESNVATAAVLIANACFLVAVPVFAHLASRRVGPESALTATLLLCVSPFSLFFSAGYTESLFLLLVVLAFTMADRRRWLVAAGFAGFAAATRLTGLALAPALLLLAWRRGASARELAGIALLSPLGSVAYAVYCWRRLDDPLAFLSAQEGWGGWDDRVGIYLRLFLTRPWQIVTGDVVNAVVFLNVVLLACWLASVPWIWRRLDPGIALFTTLLVVGHGLTTWVSLGRYLLPALGFYIALAVLLGRPGWRGWPRDLVVVVSTMLLALLTVLFAHGRWVI